MQGLKIFLFHELKVSSECSSDLLNHFKPHLQHFYLSASLKHMNSLKMSVWGITALNFGLGKIADLPVKGSVRILVPPFITVPLKCLFIPLVQGTTTTFDDGREFV